MASGADRSSASASHLLRTTHRAYYIQAERSLACQSPALQSSFCSRCFRMIASTFNTSTVRQTTARSAARSTGVAIRQARKVVVRAGGDETVQLTGVVFQPFSEVKGELAVVDKTNAAMQSFARVNFQDVCEAAINEQINIEYNVSYVYHSLFAYFDRDNVGLPGMAKFFKAASEEEREHAEQLMEYQNVRGGRVRLASMLQPETEFNHSEKGDALYAMELALSLEKLNFQKLRELHDIAAAADDAQMCDFIEGTLLAPQVQSVKQVAEYVSQLRRVGKGLGVFQFDQWLAEQPVA